MAYSDYKLCDVCEEKAFYDTSLHYETVNNKDDHQVEYLENNKPSHMVLDRLGAWAVLCNKCAKNYEAIIVPKKEKIWLPRTREKS